MPPTAPLSDGEIQDVTLWVRDGAAWPADAAPSQRTFWSFQPVRKPAPPAVKNASWARGPIDRFILAKLEQKGMQPSPEADRRTWLRRVTFDLIGLPPTPEELAAFAGDRSADTYGRVVDRLLSSPRTPTAEVGVRHSMLLAGGGVKGGITHGATDEFGWYAVEKPVHVHDLHATMLHLLGFDHTKLTYQYSGLPFRLTDVEGVVVKDILA